MKPAGTILAVPHLHVRPQSVVSRIDGEWAFALADGNVKLVIRPAAGGDDLLRAFEGDLSEHDGRHLLVGPASAGNAAALRAQLSWLAPQPVGHRTSFGFGDRLGLATPG